jgi:hypothetical protein
MTYEEKPTNQEVIGTLEAFEEQLTDNYDAMRLNAHNIAHYLGVFCPSMGLGKPETLSLKIDLGILARALDEGLDSVDGCDPERIEGLHREVMAGIERAKEELR